MHILSPWLLSIFIIHKTRTKNLSNVRSCQQLDGRTCVPLRLYLIIIMEQLEDSRFSTPEPDFIAVLFRIKRSGFANKFRGWLHCRSLWSFLDRIDGKLLQLRILPFGLTQSRTMFKSAKCFRHFFTNNSAALSLVVELWVPVEYSVCRKS